MITLLVFFIAFCYPFQDVTPLANAHAHNDYLQKRPLLDALEQGFGSVEADIFLSDNNSLLVGHTKQELQAERTLENLYLKPLRDRIQKNQGKVYPPSSMQLLLFIDLKTPAASTYPVLHQLLQKYSDILTEVRDGKVSHRAVTVILSGSRPSLDELASQSPRYAAYDGRLSDLASTVPVHLMPVISDNWQTQIRWNGLQPISPSDRNRLENIVRQAQQRHRKIRFWATPERESVWKLLHELQVDLINTDKLTELKAFLLQAQK